MVHVLNRVIADTRRGQENVKVLLPQLAKVQLFKVEDATYKSTVQVRQYKLWTNERMSLNWSAGLGAPRQKSWDIKRHVNKIVLNIRNWKAQSNI